jgi:riboflavin kinase
MNWSHLYADERKFESPVVLTAKVVHGFNRGSKELGIPTANLDMEQLGRKGVDLETGIYYGWATLRGSRYQAVVSIGWNPYFKNERKTVEAHLLSQLDDFYGEELTIDLTGYLRQEANFNGLGKLYPTLSHSTLFNFCTASASFRRTNFLHKFGHRTEQAASQCLGCISYIVFCCGI